MLFPEKFHLFQLHIVLEIVEPGNTTQSVKRIQPKIFCRKKPISRRNTLCISREVGAFPAEKISGVPDKAQLKRV